MPSFDSGLSALRASQYALEVASNNISNANTPGYHRQVTQFSTETPNYYGDFQIGNGVNISSIERIRSSITETSLTLAISDVSNTDQTLAIESQLEALFQTGDGSLSQQLDSFFGEITKLTSTPDSTIQKSAVIQQAEGMARSFAQMSTNLADLKIALRQQIDQEVELVNGKMEELADLTGNIRNLSFRTEPLAELDQRDNLLNEIAEVIEVRRQEAGISINLTFGVTSIEQGVDPIQFDTFADESGDINVTFEGRDGRLDLEGGRLPALLDAYNELIPEFEGKLDELAKGLIQQVDQLHATGIGSAGSFEQLKGVRAVDDTSIPLSETEGTFPVEAGELFFSVIDPDGNRTTQSIEIDPETQSLEDIAVAISGLDNLNSSVNTRTGLLQISASTGFQFDFTGTSETIPDLAGVSGTTTPELSGKYTGDANGELTYSFSGSGEVGISNDLFVDVFDDSGILVKQLNVGNGYEAGSLIDVVDGISISFSSGSIVDGESFNGQLISQPDETGILTALGLNSFFRGTDAHTIEVDERISNNVNLFATGRTGDAADTSNLFSMIDLQDERSFGGGTLTLSGFLSEINTEVGSNVQSTRELSVNLTSLKLRYEQERDSVSGVDLNEELIYLQEYQKAYEAAVRVIQTTDEMLEEVMNILR